MLSKSHSVAGSGAYPGVKKKKAPPRPPPPSALKNPSSGAQGRSHPQRSYSLDQGVRRGPDLIDFSTPPESPEMQRKLAPIQGPVPSKESEYSYRVGASIFYIISPLKNSVAARKEPASNPFSPPRPSAQAMMASPAKQAGIKSQSNQQSKPTIIRRPPNESNNNVVKSDPSVRSSSGSSDWSEYSQSRYGNVPASIPTSWDEPPAQHKPEPVKVVAPTIIKPAIAVKPAILPKPSLGAKRMSPLGQKEEARNYYDEPPGSEDEEECSFDSPPMPSEPPPPPPPDVGVSDWVDSTMEESAAGGEYQQGSSEAGDYHHHHHHGNSDQQVTESDKAYAIVLYDYLSDMEGDLPLQVGDLVYLTYKIDDEWLYGHCAGVEGMFPANYVNVVVPLPETAPTSSAHQIETKESRMAEPEHISFADALYQFDAETDGDLSLRPGDMVKIFGRINEDWLYGEVAGKKGQFPATFVDPVPSDLPIIENPT